MLGNNSAAAAPTGGGGSTPPPPAFIYSFGGLMNTIALLITSVLVFVLIIIIFYAFFVFFYHLYLNRRPQNPNHSTDGANAAAAAAAAPNHVIFVVDRGYRGPPGLEDAVISSYPKFSFSGNGGCEGLCSICLNEYEGQTLRRMPECPHCFHMQCIDSWLRLHGTCPLCRSSPAPAPP